MCDIGKAINPSLSLQGSGILIVAMYSDLHPWSKHRYVSIYGQSDQNENKL